MKKKHRFLKGMIMIAVFVIAAYVWEGHQMDVIAAKAVPDECRKEVKLGLTRILRRHFCTVDTAWYTQVVKASVVKQNFAKRHTLVYVKYRRGNYDYAWTRIVPIPESFVVNMTGNMYELVAVAHSGTDEWRLWGKGSRIKEETLITKLLVNEKMAIKNRMDALKLTKIINTILSPVDQSRKVLPNTATKINNNTWQIGRSPDDPKALHYEVMVDKHGRIYSFKSASP
jgi:hypothetical protein